MSIFKVFLLPGLDGTGELFKPLLEVTPDWANPVVIRYDRKRPRTYMELADEVAAKIEPGIRSILVGESFSGPVSVMLASRFQEDLAGLVLCATFVKNPYRSLSAVPDFMFAPTVLLGKKLRYLTKPLVAGNAHREISDAATAAMHSVSDQVVISRMQAIRDVNVGNLLVEIECPILYLKASRDRIMPARAYGHIKQLRSDIAVSEIDTSHMLLQTRPAEAWAAIEKFVDGHR